MWLLVNHTKSTNTLYWNSGQLQINKRQLQNNEQLWNNPVNGAISITVDRVMNDEIISIQINYTYVNHM